MAITPNKAQIEAAGLEYVEPTEIVKDTGPKALNLLAQAVVDITAMARTDAEIVEIVRAAGITGSGVREVSGAVPLPADGPRVLEFYTTAAAKIGGTDYPVDTAVVCSRTSAGVWRCRSVDWSDSETSAPTLPALEMPVVTVSAIQNTTALVSWEVVPDAAGYMLRLDGGAWLDKAAATSHNLTGMGVDTEHTVEVGAYRSGSTELGALGSATFRTTAPTTMFEDHFLTTSDPTPLSEYSATGPVQWVDGGGLSNLSIRRSAIGAQRGKDGRAKIAVPYSDGRITVAYRLPPGSNQIRVYARGAHSIIRGSGSMGTDMNGVISFGTATPWTGEGNFSIETVGQTVITRHNGVEVGRIDGHLPVNKEFTVHVFGGPYDATSVTAVRIEPSSNPITPLIPKVPWKSGDVLFSDTFTELGTAIPWNFDNGAGGVRLTTWQGQQAFERVGGKLSRVGTSFGAPSFEPGVSDFDMQITLDTIPTGGIVRFISHRSTEPGQAEAAHLEISPSGVKPVESTPNLPANVGDSWGAPQAGDVYTAKVRGKTVTFSGERADGSAMGTSALMTTRLDGGGLLPGVGASGESTGAAFSNLIVKVA